MSARSSSHGCHHKNKAMSSASTSTAEKQPGLLLPEFNPPSPRSLIDLRNPSVILIIWDLLLGIPFSLLLAVLNRAVVRWLGYEKLTRCPSGVLASRAVMLAVNLFVVWSWRSQLVRERREERVRAEIEMLDEVIVCLERVLRGVEAKEIEEQLVGDGVLLEEVGDGSIG